MNKKSLNIAAALIFVTVVSAFADFGVGGEYGFEAGPYFRNFSSATIRSDESPWVLSVNAWPRDTIIAANADNWFVNETIEKPVDFYAFWGISAMTGFDDFKIGTGARLGLGLDWFVLEKRNLEFYCQACWNPYFGIQHNDDKWKFMFRPACFPFETGARWWFR